jgi:hypothetical protein
MWVSGVVGMGTMFAESVLGVKYRRLDEDGQWMGGPMYYLRDRLGWKWIAGFFAFGLALKSLFATTTVQSHSIASVMSAQVGLAPIWTCLGVAALTGLAVLGGVKTIARVSEVLAPFMGGIYLLGAFAVLLIFWREVPAALSLVFEHAFTPISAAGGFLGAGVREAFRFGMARGVYSNEAGTGSVPIANASSHLGVGRPAERSGRRAQSGGAGAAGRRGGADDARALVLRCRRYPSWPVNTRSSANSSSTKPSTSSRPWSYQTLNAVSIMARARKPSSAGRLSVDVSAPICSEK